MSIGPGSPLLLASGSPRRRELLAQVGVPLVVAAVDVDETVLPGEGGDAYLSRVVDLKLGAALAARAARPDLAVCAVVLVADTSVLVDDQILGKPSSTEDARAMLQKLAGRAHRVATRFAVATSEQDVHAETVSTTVWFRELDDEQIARYAETGEGIDKAGAYAIQGVGAMLVRAIEGDYPTVVGLPLAAVVTALQRRRWLGPLPLRAS